MTERRSTSAYSWKIMPSLRRARRSAPRDRPVTSTSLSAMVPAVGSTSRLMQRISVDLPAPDGPISATTSPFATSRSTVSSARSPVR